MLLIFDCDGVLIDSELLHAEVETEIINKMMGTDLSPAAYNHRFVGVAFTQIILTLANENSKAFPDNVVEIVEARKAEVFRQKLRSIPHVETMLETLAAFPRCIASNGALNVVEPCLKYVDLHKLFAPHIFSAQMVKRGKPAPDLYLYAAQQFGVDPSDCLVIEDSPTGVKAAKAAGMPVIGFTGGSHCGPDYAARLHEADLLFDDMRLLPSLIETACPKIKQG